MAATVVVRRLPGKALATVGEMTQDPVGHVRLPRSARSSSSPHQEPDCAAAIIAGRSVFRGHVHPRPVIVPLMTGFYGTPPGLPSEVSGAAGHHRAATPIG